MQKEKLELEEKVESVRRQAEFNHQKMLREFQECVRPLEEASNQVDSQKQVLEAQIEPVEVARNEAHGTVRMQEEDALGKRRVEKELEQRLHALEEEILFYEERFPDELRIYKERAAAGSHKERV